jgi:hypothetical protein
MSSVEVDLVQDSKWRSSLQVVLIGALLSISIFLFEAGAAEILLARDTQCRQIIEGVRLPPDPADYCMAEWQTLMLGSASRGIVGLLFPAAGQALAWLTMAAVYAGIGAACSQLSQKWAVVVFIFLNISLIALVAGLGFLSRYIA